MLISCPKCSSVYTIKAEDVPEKGKKFKCAECGEIWQVERKDLFDENTKANKTEPKKKGLITQAETNEDDLRKMFEMLGRDTKGLFDNPVEQYSSNPNVDKVIRRIRINFSIVAFSGLIMIIILSMTAFILYYNRYDVVNIVPRMQYFYDKFELENIYYGRDLKFNDVKTDYVTKKGKHYIEVHGTITNEGKYVSKVPPIRAVVSAANGALIQEIIKDPIIATLDPQFSSLFRILIENTNNEKKILDISFLTKEEKLEREEGSKENTQNKK